MEFCPPGNDRGNSAARGLAGKCVPRMVSNNARGHDGTAYNKPAGQSITKYNIL